MKAKRIFWILAVLIICPILSPSQGSDRFYYGTYGGFPESDFSSISDSLKFNIVYNIVDTSEIKQQEHMQYYVTYSLRGIFGGQLYDAYSPATWATKAHYTLWEAEGYPGSYYGLDYTDGREVSDPSASGGKARVFERFRDLPGLVQTGPSYDQEPGPSGNPIYYTAEFRLKSPDYNPRGRGVGPGEPLCSLKVVGNGQTIAHKMVYESDFENFLGYKTFKIENYTVQNPIEFQVYWFGNRMLGVDYVKVSDENGRQLIDEPNHTVANNIKAYVDQDWVHTTIPETGDTVVYRWYLRDEPTYIDLFEPARYIDSLLRVVSAERVGFTAFNQWWNETLTNEYFLRQNPEEYHVDIYPTRWWGLHFSGPEFQQGVSTLAAYLNNSKQEAEDREKDLWVSIQAHYFGKWISDSASCEWEPLYVGSDTAKPEYEGWYCYYLNRPPTAEEVRLQTSLALCYGANSILNFCYYSYNSYVQQYGCTTLVLGLYNHIKDRPTDRWYEIKDFTGPRVEVLGSVLNQLTWQGACFHDSVGAFVLRNAQPSYIDSIVGQNPDSTYVEVGFFEGYEANHFMLVNRRCLETEHETLSVYFTDIPDGPYLVTDVFTNAPVAKICGVNPHIELTLQPGEGRLFRLAKYHADYLILFPHPYYQTIQQAIDAAVDPWTTIIVYPDTFYENIDFRGKDITVTSLFHLYPDHPYYVSQTIIDGSHSTAGSDSGSAVRFVSQESSCATLKGFTIRNGSGTLYPYRDQPAKYGGGIYCKGSSPTITNNIIIGNSVTGSGGGIVCQNASPQILNNSIKENVADMDGGGIAILPYFQEYATPIVSNNLIVDNLAGNRGGGIYYHASPFITNNTIDGDSAGVGGGIHFSSDYHGWIENNIITNSLGGGGISAQQGPEVMAYNNVWNNADGDFDIVVPEGVGDTSWGVNRNGTPCDSFYNIIGDPYFCDGYHLADSSACVNAGDNQAPYMLPVDFDGNPRVVDYADMGAYEHQSGSRGGGGAKIAGSATTAESKPAAGAPKAFELSQNYPNPFNPVTSIRFIVGSGPTHTTLKIYNLCGQLVRTLVNEEKAPGTYSVTWDGKNNSGKHVASGIYLYQLKSNNFEDTKQMALIR